jgi:hypothetical protein
MDGVSVDHLTLARVASLNPLVVFHVKFLATIVARWSR